MPNNKMILLNPGPVNLSDRVRNALLRPDLCHREVEFSQLQSRIREQLLQVYGLGSDWAAVLLTGSGTAAMEAMISPHWFWYRCDGSDDQQFSTHRR